MATPASLADSEPRFETLFEQAPFSVQLLALDGRTLRVNKAWEALWQVRDADGVKEYVLGEYNIFTDPQLEARGVTGHIRRAFAGESVELPAILYDPAEIGQPGRARWLRAFAHPIRGADGAVREVMLIHDDVTERLQAEIALRESEQRLRLATLAGGIGIWEWDIDRGGVAWSDELYTLHDLAPGTFGGRVEDFEALVHPDDRPMMSERIASAVRDAGGFSAEFRTLLSGGQIRWLSTWARVHQAGAGGRRMIGATISVDAYKKAEAALLEADRRKDEFLAMLAHELRNPLAPISTAAQLLGMTPQDPEKLRKCAEVIGRQVAHIAKLVDDLLDVSRVTRGLVQLGREVVELSAVVQSAVEQAFPLIQSQEHVLTTRLEAPHACVRGDRARLVQVLANLLNNAARYTRPGGRIELTLRTEGEHALLRVADNGQGIDAALLPHVFDLFTQGARTPDRSQGGLGIGLALVRRLVELQGGRVEAHSEGPGHGSLFTVTLPLLKASAPRHGESQPQGGPDGQALDIMVVDDNRDAADSLAALLEASGHRVDVRYDGRSALSSTRVPDVQVFILDIGLPDMDGYFLARALRQRNSRARFVALSGYGQPHDHVQSKAAGFNHHLVKPVEWPVLERVLAALSGTAQGS